MAPIFFFVCMCKLNTSSARYKDIERVFRKSMNFTSNYVFKICWILSIVVGHVTKNGNLENWPRFRIQLIVFNRTDMLYYYLVCGDVGAVRIHVADQRFKYNFLYIFPTFALCNWCSFVAVFVYHCLCRFSYSSIACWFNTLIVIVVIIIIIIIIIIIMLTTLVSE